MKNTFKAVKVTRIFAHVLLLAAAATMTVSSAKADIYESLWNFEVLNRTGQTANDFELTLAVNPSQITFLYTQPPGYKHGYPNVNVQPNAGGSLITWTGSTTPSIIPTNGPASLGDWTHFGVGWTPPPYNAVDPTFTWTADGNPIGSATMILATWHTVEHNMPVFTIKPFPDPEWVIIGIYAVLGPSPKLDDLVVGDPQWNGATWSAAFRLDTGVGWSYNFNDAFPELAGLQASYTVIVRKFGDDGGVIGFEEARSFWDVDVVPEPSAMTLAGAGLAMLALKVFRRQRGEFKRVEKG